MKSILLLLVLIFGSFLTAEEKISPKIEKEILALINENLRACQKEDIQAIDRQTDELIRQQSNMTHARLFYAYDLEYKLIACRILAAGSNIATVQAVMEVRKIKGPAFRNNRTTAVHTLIRRRDGWKFFATGLQKVEMLP